MLDMAIHLNSYPLIRQNLRSVTASMTIRSMPSVHRVHNTASSPWGRQSRRTRSVRWACPPSIATRSGSWWARRKGALPTLRPRSDPLRRRHQDGVDHMDHAVGLVDIRDADGGGTALGVDNPHLAVRKLHGQFFAFHGLELLAVGQAGGFKLAGHDVV